MPRLTNHTRETVDFIIKGEPTNGVPPTASLKPGETRDISNIVQNATYRGRIASGMISVADASPRAPQRKNNDAPASSPVIAPLGKAFLKPEPITNG